MPFIFWERIASLSASGLWGITPTTSGPRFRPTWPHRPNPPHRLAAPPSCPPSPPRHPPAEYRPAKSSAINSQANQLGELDYDLNRPCRKLTKADLLSKPFRPAAGKARILRHGPGWRELPNLRGAGRERTSGVRTASRLENRRSSRLVPHCGVRCRFAIGGSVK